MITPPHACTAPVTRATPWRACAVTAVLAGLGLVGCTKSDLIQKFTTPEDQALARSYVDLLRQHRLEELEKSLDPELSGPSLHQTLSTMADMIPSGEPTSVTLVGAQSFHTPGSSTVNLSFEYQFSGKWLVTNVALKKKDGNTTIVGFHVYPQATSLEARNRFTLSGKTPLQYAVLALAILAPLLTFWSLAVCIMTRLRGRKWPWVLFIILGIGRFAVNWTTGVWSLNLTYVQLFSASAVAPLYGPITLGVSLPLGAMVFLLCRDKLRATEIGSTPSPQPLQVPP